IADGLSRELCRWGKVAVVYPEAGAGARGSAGASASESAGATGAAGAAGASAGASGVARFGPVLERLERGHDQVVMLCGGDVGGAGWDEFCLARADRIVALVDGRDGGEGSPGWSAAVAGGGDKDAAGSIGGGGRVTGSLKGCDLAGYGVEPGSGALAGWIERLEPAGVYAIRTEQGWREEDLARTARRLAGRAVGVVLSGGGARAFAHIGALEVLLGAGLTVDKVGGVSMGAFVGGLLAMGYGGEQIDACCYEEWVRRNPINDYTIPRHSLVRGKKAEAMTERVFGEVGIEELPRPFYCASVNLKGNRLVIDRSGPLVEAVKASMSLPLIGPPRRRPNSDELLIDGSLLDNLPLAPMSAAGEGPVLAIDVKGGEERVRPGGSGGGPGGAGPRGVPDASGPPEEPRHAAPEGSTSEERAWRAGVDHTPTPRRPRLPALPETMARIALLSSANTDEAARRLADLAIRVRVPGVGLLEFHQIDAAKEAGRAAALAALEGAPSWLTGGETGASELSGRRTVVRV
ncbi:MAG TPA: patatin-like phospholipase family protein, partial [Solirubrobacteraceae bacterium]|nr:patatin-like phospholipase family protein [Solirubrobacteraceae bacterium]